MPHTSGPSTLQEELRVLVSQSETYFDRLTVLTFELKESLFGLSSFSGTEDYWEQVPKDLQEIAESLVDRSLSLGARLAEAAKSSSLTGSEDQRDVKLSIKTMRAALRLRNFQYFEVDVLHDEGSVLGLRPASQSEAFGLVPEQAREKFLSSARSLAAVLRIVDAGAKENPQGIVSTQQSPAKYRAGTAFIMMWMDKSHPELTDVADAVREVFLTFDIRAVRADDIEHEGIITDRVINEIRTAEFLFADLTGMRPNVYYEIGFAHALGKRVILFRKSGTGVHFDLAGYNCPEYENLRDLKEKLSRRLENLTNKIPAHGKVIQGIRSDTTFGQISNQTGFT
jgi:hypothetical protein